MSIRNAEWLDVAEDLPRPSHEPVLVVREIGKGAYAYRKIDFAIYNGRETDAKWNKSGVIYWMPLPAIPER